MTQQLKEYIVLTCSESSGENMQYLGNTEADSPKQAVLTVLEETTDRPVQIKKDTYDNAPETAYTAIPREHWNRFRER